MSAISVSCVIPVFNHGALLERAVLSAIECGTNEVVIVDDASTDNTHIVASQLCRELPEVKYLRNNFRAGAIYSRNRAIDASTYNLILPLDADDTLLTLQPLKDAISQDSWVFGGWRENGTNFQAPPVGMLGAKELCWITMLFWKSDWLNVGGYDADFNLGNEVWAFQRAFHCAGVKPVRVPDIIFERNTDAPRTERARQWTHVIKPLIDDKYPYKTHS